MTTSCSIYKTVIPHNYLNQGNYFNKTEVNKLYIGMTKQKVLSVLGTPMLTDQFGYNTWYYILRQEHRYESIYQKKLILTFNKNDILIKITI
nr:outer membrane protein assembly factor BamE [Candidatus Baumannia cicadellinicola]